MIRILHILTSLDRGGIETMLMNYYRKIDRERFQFDFLIHREGKFAYSDEITKMGGHIYHIKKYNPFDKEYRRQLSHFFLDHKEYSIVHCHLNCLSALPLKMAEISGIPIRISHSHIIIEGNSPKAIFKKIS